MNAFTWSTSQTLGHGILGSAVNRLFPDHMRYVLKKMKDHPSNLNKII